VQPEAPATAAALPRALLIGYLESCSVAYDIDTNGLHALSMEPVALSADLGLFELPGMAASTAAVPYVLKTVPQSLASQCQDSLTGAPHLVPRLRAPAGAMLRSLQACEHLPGQYHNASIQ
jgi:hypothetical protein